jgi:hypothetical protein
MSQLIYADVIQLFHKGVTIEIRIYLFYDAVKYYSNLVGRVVCMAQCPHFIGK